MVKTVTAEELATNLAAVIEEIQKTGEAVVISKNGWPMAKRTIPGRRRTSRPRN